MMIKGVIRGDLKEKSEFSFKVKRKYVNKNSQQEEGEANTVGEVQCQSRLCCIASLVGPSAFRIGPFPSTSYRQEHTTATVKNKMIA
jgi:hypothetical protein